jgi:integrase
MNTGAHDYAGGVMKGRIYAAVDLGLRRGEILQATNRDINWMEKPHPMLTIQWGNAKSRKERQIPLTSEQSVPDRSHQPSRPIRRSQNRIDWWAPWGSNPGHRD